MSTCCFMYSTRLTRILLDYDFRIWIFFYRRIDYYFLDIYIDFILRKLKCYFAEFSEVGSTFYHVLSIYLQIRSYLKIRYHFYSRFVAVSECLTPTAIELQSESVSGNLPKTLNYIYENKIKSYLFNIVVMVMALKYEINFIHFLRQQLVVGPSHMCQSYHIICTL